VGFHSTHDVFPFSGQALTRSFFECHKEDFRVPLAVHIPQFEKIATGRFQVKKYSLLEVIPVLNLV
jgi:hypothetical protein